MVPVLVPSQTGVYRLGLGSLPLHWDTRVDGLLILEEVPLKSRHIEAAL